MNIDDNALARQAEIAQLRDPHEESEAERRARAAGLSYIKLDGTIGCMVNGAGLAMATMDVIKHYGGEPANFLDVGGGAGVEKITTAFEIILEDPNVRAVLVNIFAGITRADDVAAGVIAARARLTQDIPLVVRVAGTREAEALELLEQGRHRRAAFDGHGRLTRRRGCPMSILLDGATRLVVQGMTGSQGSFHTRLMREAGTNVVAGVTPGRVGARGCGPGGRARIQHGGRGR